MTEFSGNPLPAGFSGVDMAGFEDCSGDAESVGSPATTSMSGGDLEMSAIFTLEKISINFLSPSHFHYFPLKSKASQFKNI